MTLNWECLCSKTGGIRHVEICPKLKNILLERETDFLSPRNRRSGNRFGIIRDLRACGYKMFFDIPTQATLRKDISTPATSAQYGTPRPIPPPLPIRQHAKHLQSRRQRVLRLSKRARWFEFQCVSFRFKA